MSGQDQGNKPVGAVMVVGGGIAGMQAALDLANAGYFVHMVVAGQLLKQGNFILILQ